MSFWKHKKKSKNAEIYRKGFYWGRLEHRFERWSVLAIAALLVLQIVNVLWIQHLWMEYAVLAVCVLVFAVHSVARLCHLREKFYHNRARK